MQFTVSKKEIYILVAALRVSLATALVPLQLHAMQPLQQILLARAAPQLHNNNKQLARLLQQ